MRRSKMDRKMKRYSQKFHELYGVWPAVEPTKYLMLCNVGIGTGAVRTDIEQAFSQFPGIDHIKMPRCSHCFLSFRSLEEAKKCHEGSHGKCVPLLGMNGPVYLVYLTAFPDGPQVSYGSLPPGARLIENFITEDEEKLLFDYLLECLKEPTCGSTLKQRQVIHFGYEFLYGANNVDLSKPLPDGIPDQFKFIRSRLSQFEYDLPWEPDQVTVNHYLPGQGIAPHVDTHSPFEDPILSLSLNSNTVMEFIRDNDQVAVVLPRRSMLVLSGESRYDCLHGIPSRKVDFTVGGDAIERGTRISLTCRKTRTGDCNCSYPKLCNSNRSLKVDSDPQLLENKHVHSIYEDVSEHFSATRHSPWPKVLEFVKSCEPGSIILDIGCGNCKYFGFTPSIYEIGCDHSSSLLQIGNSRGFQVLRSDCLQLPFKDNFADAVICIAVIHHLSTEERRKSAIREIVRVLRQGHKALIYAWSRDQMADNRPSNYLKEGKEELNDTKTESFNYESNTLPIHTARTKFSASKPNVLVPWRNKSKTYLRYYHVFEENELVNLCSGLEAKIINSYYDNGNRCVILKKLCT